MVFDIYLVRFDLSASYPYYVTYLGGNSDDYGRSIGCGSNLSVYLTGYAISTNYDVVLPNI
jgi:hypothetical protein